MWRWHPIPHRLPRQCPGLLGADGGGDLDHVGKWLMGREPAADFGGIPVAARIEAAVLVAAGWRVRLGLGVTQQHQTAHDDLDSYLALILVYKPTHRTR